MCIFYVVEFHTLSTESPKIPNHLLAQNNETNLKYFSYKPCSKTVQELYTLAGIPQVPKKNNNAQTAHSCCISHWTDSRSSVGVWKCAELWPRSQCFMYSSGPRWLTHSYTRLLLYTNARAGLVMLVGQKRHCIFGERTRTCYLVFGSPPLFWKIRPKRKANSSQHDGSCRIYCPVSTAAEGPNLSRDFVQEVKRQQAGGNAQYTSVGGTNSYTHARSFSETTGGDAGLT